MMAQTLTTPPAADDPLKGVLGSELICSHCDKVKMITVVIKNRISGGLLLFCGEECREAHTK
jgi:hypothetical protein